MFFWTFVIVKKISKYLIFLKALKRDLPIKINFLAGYYQFHNSKFECNFFKKIIVGEIFTKHIAENTLFKNSILTLSLLLIAKS